MKTINLRKKLIRQFDDIIRNDDQLTALEGVFDALDTSNEISKVPDEHYNLINESREQYLNKNIEGKLWEDVRKSLKVKYGL